MHTNLHPDQLHVAVDALVLTEKEGELLLLLSRRTQPPQEGRWALPGRLVAQDESAEDAVRKLLADRLPVQHAYSEQLYTFTQPHRDPRGRVLSVAYLVIVPWQQLQPVLEQPDAALQCFPACSFSLPDDALAFDHGEIIRTGIARLQGKLEYTDIAFRFLSDTSAFSLSELQRIFEAVLAKPQDASNFRRFVRNRYEDTGRIARCAVAPKKGKGRPAVLYTWHI